MTIADRWKPPVGRGPQPPQLKARGAAGARALAIQQAKEQRVENIPSGCAEHPDWRDELAACVARPFGFSHFVKHWRFKNRDASVYVRFGQVGLFTGQQKLVDRMERSLEADRWVFALKAGKLGFSELACAYDGWELVSNPLTRVHLFSKDATSSNELLAWVRAGIRGLPAYFGAHVRAADRGGDNLNRFSIAVSPEAMRLEVRPTALLDVEGNPIPVSPDDEDIRTIVAYAAGPNVSIDQVARHSHVDELSHMAHPEKTWGAISTTVPEGSTLHIISRGAGEAVYSARLWYEAMEGRDPDTFEPVNGFVPVSRIDPFFSPWWERDDRDQAWYTKQEATIKIRSAVSYFAPATPEDALAGNLEDIYIDLARWDQLYDPYLAEHPPIPGDPSGFVLALDAGVTSDSFGAALTSRHPLNRDRPAIRAVREWKPDPYLLKVDLDDAERWLRFLLQGGCEAGHPLSWARLAMSVDEAVAAGVPREMAERGEGMHPTERRAWRARDREEPGGPHDLPCEGCARVRQSGNVIIPPLDIVKVVYDPYQLETMMQRIRDEHLAWCDAFDQGKRRTIADAGMHRHAMQGTLSHNGDPQLREHIGNSRAKITPGEDSKLRIVKAAESKKIDLSVAASMAVDEVMELNLG